MDTCKYCAKEITNNESLTLVDGVLYHQYCAKTMKEEKAVEEIRSKYPDLHEDLVSRYNPDWVPKLVNLYLKDFPQHDWFLVYSHSDDGDYEVERYTSKEECINEIEYETGPRGRNAYWTPYFLIHDFKSYAVKIEKVVKITVEE